jgi:pimeloyl-ACP methyl ester carboxylesterase
MSSILVDGQIVHYETLGRGRPVFFLHSWVGSWRYWFPAMQFISSSFCAYGVDMWGFGESATNRKHYKINQQADLFSRLLDEMGIGKVAIIGHGLGALVGFDFCARWPNSVDRMLAVSCPTTYEAINSRMRTSPPSDLIQWLGSRSKEAKLALADATKADSRAIEKSIDSFRSDNPFSKMRQTQIPCLLVYGSNDPAIQAPPKDSSINFPPMMHQVVLNDSGHFPMLDEAVRFNRLLMDFLLLKSGVSPRELKIKQ